MKKLWEVMGVAAFWVCWPALWVYLRNTRRTRILVTNDAGEVLLLKAWLGPGSWKMPGGGLHKGEEPLAGVIRELREETGLSIEPRAVSLDQEASSSELGFEAKMTIFRTHVAGRPELTAQKFEVTHVEWVSPDQVKVRSPYTARILGS